MNVKTKSESPVDCKALGEGTWLMSLFELVHGFGKNYEVMFLNFRSLVTGFWPFFWIMLNKNIFFQKILKKNLKKKFSPQKKPPPSCPEHFLSFDFWFAVDFFQHKQVLDMSQTSTSSDFSAGGWALEAPGETEAQREARLGAQGFWALWWKKVGFKSKCLGAKGAKIAWVDQSFQCSIFFIATIGI